LRSLGFHGLRYAALAFANWRTGRRLYCSGVGL
jgi:hypothetical protein